MDRRRLSTYGNRIEFGIPDTPLGKLICSLPLVWAPVNGKLQPCIFMAGVKYPEYQLGEEA